VGLDIPVNLYDQFTRTIAEGVSLTDEEQFRARQIAGRILGYSDFKHYAFFKSLMALPIRDVLILGVYHGRDIAFMRDCLLQIGKGNAVRIVGVDKFDDTPCDDWPEAAKGKKWKEAGFGEAPSLVRARLNIGAVDSVGLEQSEDAKYLLETARKFDVVYLDTDHTAKTVSRQCEQAKRVCRPDAIICGDDYSDEGTWGVKKAVKESFTSHTVFANWIWVSSLSLFRCPHPQNAEEKNA
jgi:hypothetical protein